VSELQCLSSVFVHSIHTVLPQQCVLETLIETHCIASVQSAFKCTYHQPNSGHIPHILLNAGMSCHFSLTTRTASRLDTVLLSNLRCSCNQPLFMFLDELLILN